MRFGINFFECFIPSFNTYDFVVSFYCKVKFNVGIMGLFILCPFHDSVVTVIKF